jgi:thiol-disulfide isomerase/thioredoxin
MFVVQIYTIYLYLIGQYAFFPLQILRLLGIISAYAYFRFKNPVNLFPFCLSGFFLIFMMFQGWDYWIHFRNFGTFTGRVNRYNLPTKFESFNENKESTTDSNFNNKIVLLDFWTTTCGVCFQKFPQLQAVYERYQQDSSVLILAVDTPLEEDKPNQAFEMIKQRNYTLPVVITKEADLAEKWGVVGYPTTFVINPTGQIVYKGSIEGAIRMVDELKANK